MLEIIGLVGTDKVVSLSPFCIKLDAYMRMTGLDYRYVVGDPRKSPTGKVPYLKDGATVLSDSQRIMEYVSETYQIDVDGELPEDERARGHLIRRTVEESFYFHLLYASWVDDRGWRNFGPVMGQMLPAVARPLVLPLIRRAQRKALIGQGTARHARTSIIELAEADLRALAHVLGDQPYMLGETPRAVDATCFGFLEAALEGPETMLTEVTARHANLVAYCMRMRERYSPVSRGDANTGATTTDASS